MPCFANHLILPDMKILLFEPCAFRFLCRFLPQNVLFLSFPALSSPLPFSFPPTSPALSWPSSFRCLDLLSDSPTPSTFRCPSLWMPSVDPTESSCFISSGVTELGIMLRREVSETMLPINGESCGSHTLGGGGSTDLGGSVPVRSVRVSSIPSVRRGPASRGQGGVHQHFSERKVPHTPASQHSPR